MRSCKYRIYNYDKKIEEERVGQWHQWASSHSEYESGPGILPVAIVENPDGSVSTPMADAVVFTDLPPAELNGAGNDGLTTAPACNVVK